jgi:predicted nucleotidyltransferase
MTPAASLLTRALEALRSRTNEAKGHGLELVGVIGSVARGEAGADSDVDIAYRVVGQASLFDIGAILMDLQDELGRPVDMVDLAAVKPRLRATMERDLVRA